MFAPLEIDYTKLYSILFWTAIIFGISFILIRSLYNRLMIFSLLAGLLIYIGIGCADYNVSEKLMEAYFIFASFLVAGFSAGMLIFKPLYKKIEDCVIPSLGDMKSGYGWIVVIWAYVLLHIPLLLWPEYRLDKLFTITPPDVYTGFLKFYEVPEDSISKLLKYPRLLLAPFFYIGLFRLRHNFLYIFLINLLILYIKYVAYSYIGRVEILFVILLIGAGLWYWIRKR